jgi:hypothetical protein
MISQGAAVVLVAAKTATLVFGSALTYLAYKAYRRTGSRSLRTLAFGIGLLIVGATLGGLLHQVFGFTLELSVSIQSIFTAVGFAVMTDSLFTDVSPTDGRTSSEIGTDN